MPLDNTGMEVNVESKSKDTENGPTKSDLEKIFNHLFHWFIRYISLNGFRKDSQRESKHCRDKVEETEKNKPKPCNEMKSGTCGFRETISSLEQKVTELENKLNSQKSNYGKVIRELMENNDKLSEQVTSLKNKLDGKKKELQETFAELGRLVFDKERSINEKRRDVTFNKTFRSNVANVPTVAAVASQQPLLSQPSTSASSKQALGAEETSERTDQQTFGADVCENTPTNAVAAVSVQESREESSSGEGVSLTDMPTTAVERSLYNNYRLLLLTAADKLLSRDKVQLQEWAGRVHAVNVSLDISDVFLELDRKGVISATNLKELRGFFEKIIRIDLVHLIDCFLLGDYTPLRNSSSRGISRNNQRISNSRTGSADSVVASGVRFPSRPTAGSGTGNARNSQQAEVKALFPRNRPERQDSPMKLRPPATNCRVETVQGAFAKEADCGIVVTDGAVPRYDDKASNTICQNDKTVAKPLPSRSSSNHGRGSRDTMGSNGNKLSKFERPESRRNRGSNPQGSDDDCEDDEQWLCSHYKRHCLVKFNCCDKFWPCHRCHNNESNCGQKKLKSRDTQIVKCVNCGKEQEFSERSQFCVECHTKFAKYFCPICKHLTGTDDKPYHCEKCGICRIHGDRSFHCDICGVCLDVQLRGNHKCRAGSAHDECCICLEDAFTGCQILPCSHKVHKECATQMIRSGITRCPICRESFAHKLERRQTQPVKKHKGKK